MLGPEALIVTFAPTAKVPGRRSTPHVPLSTGEILEDVARSAELVGKGAIEEPCYVDILLDNLGTAPATAGSLAAFQAYVPETWAWALGDIGRYQLDVNMLAMAAGGHVRVGLEDNIWWDRRRSQLATNSELVQRVARLADIAVRPLATPTQVRERLALRRTRSTISPGV